MLERSRAVPEHRVGRVDHAIDRGADEPPGEEEAHRGDEAVGQILGDGFNGRRGDLPLVELGGGSAHKVVADRPPGRRKIAAAEVGGDGAGRADETSEGEQAREGERLEQKTAGSESRRERRHEHSRRSCKPGDGDRDDCAAGQKPRG